MTKLIIGKPVKPMLVAESGADEEKFRKVMKYHNGKTLAEVKYDGYRIELHKSSGLWLFTKNFNQVDVELFPEVKTKVKKQPKGIYDGEILGLEPGIRGFEAIKKRFMRKDTKLIDKYPLQIRFFDALLVENKELIDLPLYERRKILEKYVDNVSEQQEITDEDELEEKFEAVTSKGLEGLVCKNPDSKYLIGGRTKDWIKLKKFLTLDLVVLGLYKGEGKAAELPFAALLLGTKNNDRYETITKVGISDKEMINNLYEKTKDFCIENPPKNVVFSEAIKKQTYKRKVPYFYISPSNSAVVEVKALNITRSKNWHSCGLREEEAYSLRIPVVKRIREDKEIGECNTTEQIAELYEKQSGI